MRATGLATMALLLALVYFPTVAWLVHRWSLGVWFQLHGFAVFPIAGWLAYLRLRRFSGAPPAPSALGFAFLLPALALQVLDAALRTELLSAVSFFLIIPGLCLLLLGRERTKAIWFPLLFLGFAVPIPLLAARSIHLVLRHVAAAGTAHVLDFMGYEVSRQATSLQVGPFAIEIADACSGFSTLTALLMVGLLLCYLARARWTRSALLLALVFPIAMFANLVRCIVLIMLVAAFDADILGTMLHPGSGVATFLLGLLLMMRAERWILPPKEVAA
ncbi:MAG: exosortase/archaeosortase family protein [Planctomycetota bacterium]|jgi:exosortase